MWRSDRFGANRSSAGLRGNSGMGAELLRSISAAPLPYGSVKGFGHRHPARARRKAPCGRRPKASLGGNRGRRWLCLDERDLWGFEDRGRKRATRHLPPQRHGRARMGAFLSIGRGAFFAPRGGECCDGLEARSRPSISWAARDVGERGLVKAEAAGGGGRRPAFTRVRSPTSRADQEIEGRERASSQSQHSPPRGAKKSAAPY